MARHIDIREELPSITALGAAGATIGLIPSLFLKSQKGKKLRNALISGIALPSLYLGYARQRNILRQNVIDTLNKNKHVKIVPAKDPLTGKSDNKEIIDFVVNLLEDKNVPGAKKLSYLYKQDPFEKFNKGVWNGLYPQRQRPVYAPGQREFLKNLREKAYALSLEYSRQLEEDLEAKYWREHDQDAAYDKWVQAHEAFNNIIRGDKYNYTPDELEALHDNVINARDAYYGLFNKSDLPDSLPEFPTRIFSSSPAKSSQDYNTFLKAKGFDFDKEKEDYITEAKADYAKQMEDYRRVMDPINASKRKLQDNWGGALAVGYGIPASYLLLKRLFTKRNKKRNNDG